MTQMTTRWIARSAYWLDELEKCPVCGNLDAPGCAKCNFTGFIPFETAEDYISMAVTEAERERMAAWLKFDICARVRQEFGTTLDGTLAETLNVGTRRIRTFVALGKTFPPDSRSYLHDPELYIAGLKADDPVGAIEYALTEQYSPRQLREWLAAGGDDETVTEVHELIHWTMDLATDEIPLAPHCDTTWIIPDWLGRELTEALDNIYFHQPAQTISIELHVRGTFPKENQNDE